jgi:nucleotide-binding universal stress UspA family protein
VDADNARSGVGQLVERVRPDLVCMATHGRSGVKHLLLGSIAERVVQKAPCPVLTVKSAEQADA